VARLVAKVIVNKYSNIRLKRGIYLELNNFFS